MRGNFLLLLQVLVLVLATMVRNTRGDIFHYYKLKKIVTALAFARAIGRRPTLFPVPIPIPIPISKNEVIRIPGKGGQGSKAATILAMGGDDILHQSPQRIFQSRRLPTGYVGASDFGYSLPGTYDSQSIVDGSPNIVVLNGNNGFDDLESDYASPSNVIRLVSGQPRRRPRKPVRQIIITGPRGVRGKTMRTSENFEFVDPLSVQSGRRKGKRKKPIPVGEKFRLP